MRNRVRVITFLTVLGLAALVQAQTLTTLYAFTGSSDGANPYAGVIQDTSGNLYGTAEFGGNLNCNSPSGCGVVYKLGTSGTQAVLHTFSGSPDGALPIAPLARDAKGNVYGTTINGGSNPGCSTGCGVIFKVDVHGRESVVYNFCSLSGNGNACEDGCYPQQGLLVDDSGDVYGTTSNCGLGRGTIFGLDSAGNFTLLHSFTGSDGAFPQYGHLTMDESGNLYGVTFEGGSNNDGVVYEMSKSGTFAVLHSFTGSLTDGCYPYGSVARDKSGNLYGTTYGCGSNRAGTIWRVNKNGKETILHNFAAVASDGCFPYAGVTLGAASLYGVTSGCGSSSDGAVYELSANGALSLLHSFDGSDGDRPFGEVLRATSGALFGTTGYGGTYNAGTVWSYVP